MPVGKPDWSSHIQDAEQEPQSDLAELAVRLGSIYTHYRTGNYVWSTSFEGNDASYVILNGGTGVIADYTTLTQSGANAKSISIPSTAGGVITLTRYEPFIVKKGLGFAYSIKAGTNSGDHIATIQIISENKIYNWRLKYDSSSFEWSIWDGASYNVVHTVKINDRGPDNYYDRIKLVIDVESKHFLRLIINGKTIDISAFETSGAANTASEVAAFWLEFVVPGSGTNLLYVDDLIITQNEPLS